MKLDHLQLAMPPGGENRARRYWGGIFEMEEETKPAPLASRGGCWFRRNTVILHIGVEPNFVPQQKAHPAFIVDDLDALAERLTATGHPVNWDESLPDRTRFYTTDPFGNRIEILREGDGFTQR
jgi:catechol 2,3-dioxygenase-like lactoylglutathione lyase family enzyme